MTPVIEPWMIEKIEEEIKKQKEQEQQRIQLPLPILEPPTPLPKEQEKEDTSEKRGVIIIDIGGDDDIYVSF